MGVRRKVMEHYRRIHEAQKVWRDKHPPTDPTVPQGSGKVLVVDFKAVRRKLNRK